MVMSTVKVKAHSIRLGAQEQNPVIAVRNEEASHKVSSRSAITQTRAISTYSISSFLLNQNQQKATSVQIASESLQLIGKELMGMKRVLSQILNGQSQADITKINDLSKSKNTLENLVKQAQFDGKRLIDNQLGLNFNNADIRQFSIPGLDVHRMNEKRENIRLDFPQGQSVVIEFDGHSDSHRTVNMLDRSIISMGMRASLADDGNILFSVKDVAYEQMKERVFVTGEGHRFPAGQPNVINLKPKSEGISELKVELDSREGIKRSISTINKHLNNAHISLSQAKLFNNEILSQQDYKKDISIDQVYDIAAGFINSSETFLSTFQAINAQANVKRHTVLGLLK